MNYYSYSIKQIFISLCITYFAVYVINLPAQEHCENTFVDPLAVSTLYAPWRDSYQSHVNAKPPSVTQHQCPFCTEITDSDDQSNFILCRYRYHVIALNRFPYTNKGHILIIPYAHVSDLDGLSKEARQELIELESASIALLKKIFKAPGVNSGRNLGRAAGASIPGHLHTHIIPRFHDDRSFIQLIGKTEVISCNLLEQYLQLQPHFHAIKHDLRHSNAQTDHHDNQQYEYTEKRERKE